MSKTAASLPLQPENAEMLVEHPWLTADIEKMMVGMSPDERAQYIDDVERIRAQDRKPFGSFVQKLEIAKRSGYDTHWFNDTPGRVDTALANGWTHRKGKDEQPVRRVVGSGRDGAPMYAYAMDLPMIFRQEDMDRRHAEASARMEDIKKNPIRAPAGMAKREDRGRFYSPVDEVISVKDTIRREPRTS